MAIDFPASPSVNDQYTYNGQTWKWNGVAWITLPPSSLTIGSLIVNSYAFAQTTISSSNNININCASGNFFKATCNGSYANIYFTNAPSTAGMVYSLTLQLANAGINTVSWANSPHWPGAVAPTASANTDIWVFFTADAGANWYGNQVQKDTR